jgi:hypothetical protein
LRKKSIKKNRLVAIPRIKKLLLISNKKLRRERYLPTTKHTKKKQWKRKKIFSFYYFTFLLHAELNLFYHFFPFFNASLSHLSVVDAFCVRNVYGNCFKLNDKMKNVFHFIDDWIRVGDELNPLQNFHNFHIPYKIILFLSY